MQCKNCGTEGVFHRVILERAGDEFIGGLCKSCDVSRLSEPVDTHHGGHRCSRCETESEYLLAEVDLVIESDEGNILEYEIIQKERHVGVCHEHLLELIAQPIDGVPTNTVAR